MFDNTVVKSEVQCMLHIQIIHGTTFESKETITTEDGSCHEPSFDSF